MALLLVIDQARFDYLVRFRPLLTGGLKTILEGGCLFTVASHNHSATSTAPGHAALVTGLNPSGSGIVGNSWFDKGSRSSVYCVADRWYGRSPRNLQGSALGDWMKEQDPRSKVFAAGPKDRASILMGGHNADAAYWYNSRTGEWVTSRYYRYGAPAWLEEFHDRKLLDAYFGRAWEPIAVDPAVAREMGIEPLDTGAFARDFPYPIGGFSIQPDSGFYGAIYNTPFIDLYLVRLAEALIEEEGLGDDLSPDFLGLSFSALDAVGHQYGPNSPEILDVVLRLDRWLDELLATVDRRVGLENVVISVSADHGVVPLPEYQQMYSLEGRRMGVEDVLCFQNIGKSLEQRFGEGEWVLRGFYLNDDAIERNGHGYEEVELELARLVGECPAVEKVWTRTQIESGKPPDDPDFELFRNNFFPGRSPDLMVQYKPYELSRAAPGTTHGSPYDYDKHVPLMIMAPGISQREVSRAVHTVDLAPTLATLLRVPSPDGLDGVDLSPMLFGW